MGTPKSVKTAKTKVVRVEGAGHTASEGPPGTLGEPLARFTAAAINGVSDATVRETLKTLHAFATAVQSAFAAGTTGPNAHDHAVLQSVNVAPDAVLVRVTSALALMDAVKERDARKAQWQALVESVNAQEASLDAAFASTSSTLRGAFGNTATALKKYGVKPLGGGGKKGPRSASGTAKGGGGSP